jgi:endonuclease-3
MRSKDKLLGREVKSSPKKANPSGLLRDKPKKLSLQGKRQLLNSAFARFRKIMPEPKCELYYQTPYQLLVSVVLSAQATDKIVNACMRPVYQGGFTPENAIAMGEAGILSKIRPIGLAPTKAKNVYKLSQILLETHQGQVPSERSELEALPGVGRKTANVILGEIFRQPTLAVDTHVFRVGFRLGLHQERSPEKAEASLLKLIDSSYLPDAHHWFILHGRYTCKAMKPNCQECCVRDLCPSLFSV